MTHSKAALATCLVLLLSLGVGSSNKAEERSKSRVAKPETKPAPTTTVGRAELESLVRELEKHVKKNVHWHSDIWPTVAKKSQTQALVKAGKPAVPILVQLLSRKGNIKRYGNHVQAHEVRDAAAYILGEVGDERAIVPLFEAYVDHSFHWSGYPHGTYRFGDHAEHALAKFGQRAVPYLLARFSEKQKQEQRAKAAAVLSRIGDLKVSRQQLMEIHLAAAALCISWDSDLWYRSTPHHATNAVVKIGKPVVPFLIRKLDGRHDERRAAAYILGEIGDHRAIAPLVKAYTTGDFTWSGYPSCRYQCGDHAGAALAKFKQAAVPALLKELEKSEPKRRCGFHQARYGIAIILGEIGDKRAIPVLIEALKDRAKQTRQEAARVLGNLGDKRAVRPLMQVLKDSERWVRWYAIRALGRMGADAKEAVPALKQLEKDNDNVVSFAAKCAIKDIEKKKGEE